MKDRIQQEQKSSATRGQCYAVAERRMQFGRRLVFGGFVVALSGIAGYCLACLGTGSPHSDWGKFFLENPERLTLPTLAIIGLGTLLWIVGSFIYLNGAMDSDPDGPDLYF